MTQVTSNKEQIITDIIEKGSIISQVAYIVNRYHCIIDEEELTKSNVSGL